MYSSRYFTVVKYTTVVNHFWSTFLKNSLMLTPLATYKGQTNNLSSLFKKI